MSDNIILFPEIEKLKTEISSLKARISELLCMRDQMLFVECKNIEMEYMLALGDLEYKAYELNCHMLRLKRKAELIQACKNRQEKIILSEIENILDTEFADYQARLDEQLHKMNIAIERSRGERLSEERIQKKPSIVPRNSKSPAPRSASGTRPRKAGAFPQCRICLRKRRS